MHASGNAAADDVRHLEDIRRFLVGFVKSYIERTNIHIQLVGCYYHPIPTWRELSRLTKRTKKHHLVNQRIADQTRRESMAMFTLALVTVLFLPGTFVPSIMSTSFFNFDGTAFKVSDNITTVLVPSLIGATLLVLLLWFAWYPWRLYRLSRVTAKSDEPD
ncbi:hypothetical protein PG988_007750 [Apiospora saccharicola]